MRKAGHGMAGPVVNGGSHAIIDGGDSSRARVRQPPQRPRKANKIEWKTAGRGGKIGEARPQFQRMKDCLVEVAKNDPVKGTYKWNLHSEII